MIRSLVRCVLVLVSFLLLNQPAKASTLQDFVFGGNAPWFSQTAVSHDGIDAYQSGAVSNSQSSWMEAIVAGPGAVRFWWKVSSESCCDPLTFSIDGMSQADVRGVIDWQSRAFAVPEGSHTLRWIYSTDSSVLSGSNAGWVDQVTFEAGSNIDVTPPVTSATPAGGTYASSQSVTLVANEPSTIYYTTNGSEPTTSSNHYSAPLTISSSTALKYFAVDTAGSAELTKTAYYTIDTTPPSTSAYPNAGTYAGQRSVSLYCSDSGMGCASIYYCLGSGCTPSILYSSPVTVSVSTDLRYSSTDLAGNSEPIKTATYSIMPDTIPPTTSVNAPSGTYGPSYIYFNCNDGDGSGCTSTYYCLGAGCTPTTPISASIYITASTDLRFYSQDRAGNDETVKSVSYVIDTTPPVTTATPPGGSYSSAPLITLACSDGTGTGCARTYYCTGVNCTPSTLYSGPISINDSTILSYSSQDNANNNEAIVTQSYINSAGQPKTITVPAAYATIQAAIDAAYNGDTVLVASGTYVENINFKGKNITVTSSDGREVTIIDGNKEGSVVTFSSGETSAATLSGFTIRNGASSWRGGGINIDHASPTVQNNRITGNSASWGAGIAVSFASPLIHNNIITSNNSSNYGGGIHIGGETSSAQIIDNTIFDNACSDGGGISLWAAGTTLIKGNVIKNNRSYSQGGGIWSVNSSNATIMQNLIVNNTGASYGGIYDGSDSYINNTIVNNDSNQGEGVFLYSGAFINNIVAAKSGQPAISRSASYLSNFSHNIIYSPSGNAYATGSTDQNGINGNITADPLLANPQLGYYGLLAGSPTIDAGDNSASSLLTTDFVGMPRLVDGNNDGTTTVDIGAYEFDSAYPVATLQGIPTAFLASDSLSLTVGGTGVTTYRYALDGGAFSVDTDVATPISLIGLANGQHTIVVLGKSTQGVEQLLSSATAAAWVVNTETTDLIFTNGGNAPWFIQPLVSRDGIAYQSGTLASNQSSWMETTVTGPGAIRFWWKVSSAQYSSPLSFSIDGTSQTSISGDADWLKQAYAIPAGSHTLRWTYTTGYYPSGSNAGWLDQISFEQGSSIDVTPPVTSATPAAGMYGTPQSVTLSCSDSSSCTGTFYCLGSGCTPSTPYTGPINVSAPAELRFHSTDTAGNYELVKTATYTLDTTPPGTSVYPPAGTYEGQRSVSLSCYDSASNCASTYYCLGSGCTPTIAYNEPITVSSSTDLRYYSTDRFGNNETVKSAAYTITPDDTPPTTTTTYPSGTYSNPYVSLHCSDGNGSGCAAIYYCLGADCTPINRFTTSLTITSSTDLRFYSQDNSGNSETIKTVSYTIDNTSPTTTVTPAGGIYTGTQNVTLACGDGTGSGCSSTYYCLGNGCYPSTPYSGPINITSSTYLSYYSRDMVQNRENTKTERYTVLTAPPATINVPADHTTIQAAIDAANEGDTVLVAPGTYVENIDFKGKAITVASSGGADVTIIDGNQAGRVVTFNAGEWYTSVLSGFTIRNGNAPWTYPIYGQGGGIYISGASPVIINNNIIQNRGFNGAGIYAGGSPIIRGNLISGNSRSPELSGGFGGGGVYLCGESALIEGNTISNNTGVRGGGIYLTCDGRSIIRGNVISHNGGTDINGGGIYVDGFSNDHQIVQNLIIDNNAGYGGGMYLTRGILVAGNTIAGNSASEGSGIYLDSYSYGTGLIINNIIAGKSGQTTLYSESSSELNPPLRSNILFSTTDNVYGGTFSDQNGLYGNITADPQLSGPEFGYYGLRPGSPAIDAGDNSVPSLPSTDLNGAPRSMDGSGLGEARVDIGAYEFDPAESRAVVSGAPTSATRETAASLTVSGTDIISYRYALDGGPFTTDDIPVSTPIILTDLPVGSHAVAVIGKTLTREQLPSSATVVEWTIDTAPPVTSVSPASGVFTAPQLVTLTCSDGSGSGCAATYYCFGADCIPTILYSGPIAINSATGLRYFSEDVFGYREEVRAASFNFTGSISGIVTDSGTGAGIQGVTVTVYSAATGSWIRSGQTGSNGAYSFTGLPSGNYKLKFYANNYVEQWYSDKSDRAAATIVLLTAPGTTAGINVTMIKGGDITGSVTAKETGIGIPGVYVAAYNAISGSPVKSVSTDDSGYYRISGLAAGDYKILFDSQNNSGYLDRWYGDKGDLSSAAAVTVTNAGVTSGVNGALPKGGGITGSVTDSVSGTPIVLMNVTAYDAVSGSWINSASTDSYGVYTLTGLSGSYKLNFSGSGYIDQWYDAKASQSAATSVAVVAPNVTSGVNMVMVKGGRITGTVTDATSGSPIPWVSISAYSMSTGSYIGYGMTAINGVYSIDGLPTGNYKLRFSASDYVDQWYGNETDRSAAATIAITAPNTASDINMSLVRGAAISGTVTDKDTGYGIQGIYVEAYNVASGAHVKSGHTDGLGTYSLTGLASGSYKIHFTSLSGAGYLDQWYSGKDQKSTADIVEVVVPNNVGGIDVAMAKGATVTGTVTDRQTGAVIQGVAVTAYGTVSGATTRTGYTDSYGVYSISGLATGSYKLVFNRSGYLSQWYGDKASQTEASTVSVTVPETTADVDVAMVKGGGISGTITDRITGVGIDGVYLYAISRSTGDWVAGAYSDATGNFSIAGLPSGTYRLGLSPPSNTGYLGGWYGGQESYLCSEMISVTAPDTTAGVDIRLDMGGSISGKVTDVASGEGIAGVNISVMNTTSHAALFALNMSADSSGAYTLGGLPSGEYSLSFRAIDYVRMANPTNVTVSAPAAVSGVDVSLTKGGGVSGRVVDSDTGEAVRAGFDFVTGEPSGGVMVEAVDAQTGQLMGYNFSDGNGNYTITGLPSGSFKLHFMGREIGYANGWYSSQSGETTVTPVIVDAPVITTGIDMSLARQGAISGRITDSESGAPLKMIPVAAYDAVSDDRIGSTYTGSDGTYRITGLPSGSYRVRTDGGAPSTSGYLSSWYRSASDSAEFSEVMVQTPETTSGIDIRLDKGGAIAGMISLTSCPAPRQVNIRAYDAAGKIAGQAWVGTNYTERFTIGSLPAGSYRLAIDPVEPGFLRQWYPLKADAVSAEPITVTAGVVNGSIDVSLSRGGGSISGKVTGAAGSIFFFASVKLYDWYSGSLVAESSTGHGNSYQLNGLPDGTYKLLFTVNQYDRWYRAADEPVEASPVVVSGGGDVSGIDLVMPNSNACGNTDGATMTSVPTSGLCAAGIPSAVSGSGPWTWSCSGVGSGGAVSCAAIPPRSGVLVPEPGKTGPDIGDAVRVLNIAYGRIAPTPADLVQGDLAPLDSSGKPLGDNVIDTYDVIGMLRKVAGLL